MRLHEKLRKLCAHYLEEETDALLRFEIEQLQQKSDGIEELEHRLGKHLEFGTAGVRARMEAGYNRMNIVSVYRFAHALGSLLQEQKIFNKSAVIGFDARLNGQIFANEMKTVLQQMGIGVHFFESPVPTPLCAFATKYVKALIGIMITASHNPGYDNGIKLFNGKAAQAFGPLLQQIEARMIAAPLRPQFYATGKIGEGGSTRVLGADVEDAYFSAIRTDALFSKDTIDRDVKIAYTALHGVGQKFFMRALHEEGFDQVISVDAQAKPDGTFPTLVFPNPEEDHVLDRVYDLAIEQQCPWVFANDPDADRLQVASRDAQGDFYKLSGNEMGALLGYFAIENALKKKRKPLVASSLVSSRMLEAITKSLGVQYVDAQTGFSNIVHAALAEEKVSGSELIFAYEEAIGFSVGRTVLDKDGISSGLRFMEIIAWLKRQNISVFEFLDQLSLRFGLFSNCQWSMRYEGIYATDAMKAAMARVRAWSSETLQNIIGDSCARYDLASTGNRNAYQRIQANIVIFEIKDRYRFIVRPSGTEPKIKFYLEIMDNARDLEELALKKVKLSKLLLEQRNIFEKLIK